MDSIPTVSAFTPDASLASMSKNDARGVRRRLRGAVSWELDLFTLSSAMLMVLLAPPLIQHEATFATIFSLRISLINFFLAAICLVLWRGALRITRLRRGENDLNIGHHAVQIALAVTSCTIVFALALWLRHPERMSSIIVIAFWLLSFLLFLLNGLALSAFESYVQPFLRRERQVLIVGSGWRGRRAAEELRSHPKWHYNLIGFIDDEAMGHAENLVGAIEDLDAILMKRVVDEVIIALPMKSKYDEIQMAINACERAGIQSGYSMDIFDTRVTKRRSLEKHDPSGVVLHMVHNDHGVVLKRMVDVVVSILSMVALAPLLIFLAILVKLTSPGPIIFAQIRYGLNKRTFKMYKFRSMVADAELQQAQLECRNETTGPVFKIEKDPRITTFGSFIRKTSLDELPQLLNVLLGDMSLVGPRPLPMRDVNRFSEASLMRRFSVRPGMTGLWQVSGRSNLTFANWIKLDLEYIDQWTILLDLKILARTFPAVLKKDGAV
jgi:exopolysaccharide biosynthesis polyprenyl glycosylphosphotransferase